MESVDARWFVAEPYRLHRFRCLSEVSDSFSLDGSQIVTKNVRNCWCVWTLESVSRHWPPTYALFALHVSVWEAQHRNLDKGQCRTEKLVVYNRHTITFLIAHGLLPLSTTLSLNKIELFCEHIPEGMDIKFQSENGLLGMGPYPMPGEEHPDLINLNLAWSRDDYIEMFMRTDIECLYLILSSFVPFDFLTTFH